MATEAENIQETLNNIAQQLKDLSANPKLTYSENGRTVGWTEHQANLISMQERLRAQLQKASGPHTTFA